MPNLTRHILKGLLESFLTILILLIHAGDTANLADEDGAEPAFELSVNLTG